MSYQSRKAVARSFLILMLVAILSFAIIIYAINQFFTRADQEVDEPVCRASILTRVKATLGIYAAGTKIGDLTPFPIICKTQHKVLEGNREQVMMQISDLSARCWWMFLNGEYGNIFNKIQVTSNQKCFICYFFSIKEDIKISGKELMDYMGENDYITQKDEEGNTEGVTYLNYIQSWKGSGRIFTSKDIEFVGKEEEVYSIYFISPDLTLWGKGISAILKSLGINEDSKEMNIMYIENMEAEEQLKTDCKVLESI